MRVMQVVGLLVLIVLMALAVRVVFGAETLPPGTVWKPAIVACPSPELFKQVMEAPDLESGKVIAQAQIDTGTCIHFGQVTDVGVYEAPVTSWPFDDDQLLTVYQVWTEDKSLWYIFVVTTAQGA